MSTLVDPVALLWLFLLFLGLFCIEKRQRLAGTALILLGAGWWVLEFSATPARLLATLEAPYTGKVEAGDATFDAIVVLGGGLQASANDFAGIDFGHAADRVLTGVDLALRRRGSALVLGGSSATHSESAPEPELVRQWIARWGLTDVPIFALSPCRNTYDEAQRAAVLAEQHGWRRMLLVTSAWHLPRAHATFLRVGLDVVPVGCDFVGTATLERPGRWIPQTHSLVLLQLWLREFVGIRYYRWRGWASEPEDETPVR